MYRAAGRSVALSALGAEERSNPLPTGSYWVDVFADNRPKMASWAKANRGSVQVLSTQTVGDDDEDPTTYDEYTFKVSSPVAWDARTFGYPEIIAPPAAPPKSTTVTSPSGSAPKPPAVNSSGVKPPVKPPLSSNTTVLVAGAVAVLVLTVTVAMLHKSGARAA